MTIAIRPVLPVAVSRKVAVLDDDLAYIRLVERILARIRDVRQPITTLDPLEAVAVIDATGCTEALVDVYMYGDAMGFTLVRRIRDTPATSRLPIVVASGAHREVVRRADVLDGLRCSVLLKPFEPNDLTAKLDEARRLVAGAPIDPCPEIIIAAPEGVGYYTVWSEAMTRIKESTTVQASVDLVYQAWHNFENFPRFMDNIEDVRVVSGGRSH